MAARSDMTAITWRRMAEMQPIANLGRFMDLGSPLVAHNAKFVADRKRRIEKVSKMTQEQQNVHYRKLGYFK